METVRQLIRIVGMVGSRILRIVGGFSDSQIVDSPAVGFGKCRIIKLSDCIICRKCSRLILNGNC